MQRLTFILRPGIGLRVAQAESNTYQLSNMGKDIQDHCLEGEHHDDEARGKYMPSEPATSSRRDWWGRLKLVCTPRIVRRALGAAVLVGSVLILLNQGDVLLSGHIPRRVIMKSLLTPMIPFGVTLLGAFLNTNSTMRSAPQPPGWAAIRRSIIIAVLVGGTIVALNQGDVLLAGAVTPLVLGKILLTPCVPFCVSLYGAYVMYKSATARSQP